MGKASKWFRDLLGLKKPEPGHNPAHKPPSKNRWSFNLSRKDKHSHKSQNYVVPGSDDEASRHAIAVAAATAAVAEAAVAAAQAAAAVVKLTSTHHASAAGAFNPAAHVTLSGARYGRREERAAVTIQSHFRAYLSRRALRALKALVKLQALVRGHIVRKHYVEKLRQLQAIARAQARTRATAISSPSNHIRNSSRSNSYVSYDQDRRRGESRPWEQGCFPADDDEAIIDKILQVDTWKPKRKHIFHASDQTRQSPLLRGEAQSLSPLKLVLDLDENGFTTAENSPQYYSASSMGGSSRRAPFTPTKSDDSRSCLSGYSDHPSYMAYTESSKAKVRSLSAPKQRPQYERSSSTNRYSLHGYGDLRSNTHKAASTLHASFTSKAYPGSGRLDRLGIPLRGDGSGFNGGYWHRY